ncbi:hypothetical protein Cgig2_004963 [Carnegiea gigantea]|uniref:Uncharacterized protein n=1 Tax=Carnegiea gigantea TaxID=171969 RepID=A0A9Q1L205_9CARY|nr:hypothetical protein Cgig2_004963 [Carnegiea gigantea]
MRGSTSSRRSDHEQETVTCPTCKGMRKVSNSSQNPGRMYAKCLRCDTFLEWVDEANPNLENRLLTEIEIVKHELMELKMVFKILEKGQSVLAMLEISSLSSLSSWLLSSSPAYPKFSSTSLSNTPTSAVYGWHNECTSKSCKPNKSTLSISKSKSSLGSEVPTVAAFLS